MKVANADIMRKIDRFCIDTLGIPGIVLMENAALKVIKNINMKEKNTFVVVCGKGNNGGDGFAIARHLSLLGKKVNVFLVGHEEGMSEDCRINYGILKNMGMKIGRINNVEDINEFREYIIKSDVTIDALFGTGLKKKVEGIYDTVITVMNENSSYILAVDVPSGFDSDTGKKLGNAIRATLTVSFGLYKKGFINYGTDKYTGSIVVEDIGIPKMVVDKFHNDEFIMDEFMIKENLHVRDKYSHKGDYGRVLIIAGSEGFTGAAYISAEGAVKSGSGLVTLCCHKDIRDIMCSKLVEAMTITFSDKESLMEHVEKSDAIAIGPGMGSSETTLELVKCVLSEAECPVVLDADAINVLKEDLSPLKNRKCSVILTPHLGEMSRITGLSIDYITENRVEVAKNFAKEHSVIILLKGYNTIITDGETTVINPTGNSSMASGGMGDCLTGMITSFIGQGYEPMTAAFVAAYIHGYCGEKLSQRMFCVSASSILEEIPLSIKEIQQ